MDDPTTDNQTPAQSTPESDNGAGNTIENIMGTMASDKEPETKPEGTKTEGTKADEGQTNPAWMQQLPKEIRDNADVMKQLAKFNTIGDVAKSYSELEGKLGKSLIQPGDDASDEEKNTFWKKLGKPESAKDYALENDQNDVFAQMAYDNNLTVAQAQSLWRSVNSAGELMKQQQINSFQQQAKATQDALQAEYGKDYNAKIQMLQRGVNTYGGKALGEKLKATGLIADLDVVKMFIRLGEQNAEAGTVTKTPTGSGYKSISNGGHLSFGNDFK